MDTVERASVARSSAEATEAELVECLAALAPMITKQAATAERERKPVDASAHFLDNPLQRILRDLNTTSCHTVFDLDVSTENCARLLVGLPANAPV